MASDDDGNFTLVNPDTAHPGPAQMNQDNSPTETLDGRCSNDGSRTLQTDTGNHGAYGFDSSHDRDDDGRDYGEFHVVGPDDKSGGSNAAAGYIGEGIKLSRSLYRRFASTSKPIFIAVMGMTGSGKTTFVSKVTGRKDLRIGHDLSSCTQEIQMVEARINDHTVCFVDTPGFSDTHLSDTEVLEMIADYLSTAYRRDTRLSGIIYLHRISDNRFTHHAARNLELFRKLTGEKNLKNVVLTTTMWDRIAPDKGERRERQLLDEYWKVLLAYGAKTARHAGTAESAREITTQLLGNTPFYVRLQEEMGADNTALRDTEAGREVMAELIRMRQQHEKELADMRDEIRRASAEQNKTVAAALEEVYVAKIRDLEKTLGEERRMNEAKICGLEDRIQKLESGSHDGGGGGGGGCVIL